MATRIVEWKNKENTEYEIMVYVYNYSIHRVIRYFKNAEGIITKDIMQVTI